MCCRFCVSNKGCCRRLSPSIPYSLMPRPHLWGEGLVTSSRSLGREISFHQLDCRKHNLWEQHSKVLATLARWHSTLLVGKLVLNYAYSKLWIFNEAQGISWMSPDPLLTGGVWGRDYGMEGASLLQQPLFVEQYTRPNKKSQSIKSPSNDF